MVVGERSVALDIENNQLDLACKRLRLDPPHHHEADCVYAHVLIMRIKYCIF